MQMAEVEEMQAEMERRLQSREFERLAAETRAQYDEETT